MDSLERIKKISSHEGHSAYMKWFKEQPLLDRIRYANENLKWLAEENHKIIDMMDNIIKPRQVEKPQLRATRSRRPRKAR